MTNRTIKVLHIMNGAVSGGISMTVLNMYKVIDKEKYRFDFALYDMNLGQNGLELLNLGCNFYKLPLKSKHPVIYLVELAKLLRNKSYDAVHVHYNQTSFYPLFLAKIMDIKIRIAHAHTNREDKNFFKKKLSITKKKMTNKVATILIACTKDAAIATFGKECLHDHRLILLKNSIDINRFRFDPLIRVLKQEELGIKDKFVLGCVGNLVPEKNTQYTLRVFQAFQRVCQNSVLLIIGSGPLEEELKRMAVELGIISSVIFLGTRPDVNDYLQSFDFFIMPSLYEGFGIAAIEAAASGLPIFLSSSIPVDFKFYSRCHFLSVNLDPALWAKEMLKISVNNEKRYNGALEVKNAGYDLASSKYLVEKFYEITH